MNKKDILLEIAEEYNTASMGIAQCKHVERNYSFPNTTHRWLEGQKEAYEVMLWLIANDMYGVKLNWAKVGQCTMTDGTTVSYEKVEVIFENVEGSIYNE